MVNLASIGPENPTAPTLEERAFKDFEKRREDTAGLNVDA